MNAVATVMEISDAKELGVVLFLKATGKSVRLAKQQGTLVMSPIVRASTVEGLAGAMHARGFS